MGCTDWPGNPAIVSDSLYQGDGVADPAFMADGDKNRGRFCLGSIDDPDLVIVLEHQWDI